MNGKAVIICGGTITRHDYIKNLINPHDTVICADSGYDRALELGLTPELCVGDFDSVSKLPENVKTVRYPTKKDMTDSEIAIEHARAMGFSDFLLIGATGSRMDHTLTNIFLLKKLLEQKENAVIIDGNNKIMITDSALKLNEPKGTTVSLIPLSDCGGVTTYNLEYPLCDAVLRMGEGLGVSNIMTNDEAAVSVRSGVLLVIIINE